MLPQRLDANCFWRPKLRKKGALTEAAFTYGLRAKESISWWKYRRPKGLLIENRDPSFFVSERQPLLAAETEARTAAAAKPDWIAEAMAQQKVSSPSWQGWTLDADFVCSGSCLRFSRNCCRN